MHVELASEIDFEGWRQQARALAARAVPASDVHWRITGEIALPLENAPTSLPGGALDDRPEPSPSASLRVPRAFVELARRVVLHRSPDRFAALYAVLLRLKTEPALLDIDVDPDVMRVRVFERQVRHDEHRMHAYVRFRKVDDQYGAQFVAWYEPEHHIVEATAEFFQRRFAGQRWAILTPERSVYWDGKQLALGSWSAAVESASGRCAGRFMALLLRVGFQSGARER